MATASGSRDSRRRRIVDRGSDRLALITGRIQTLPSPPTSPHDDASSPPSLAGPDHAHISGVSHHTEDKFSETPLQKLESSSDSPQHSLTEPESSRRHLHEDTSKVPAFKDQTSTGNSQLPNLAAGPKPETTLSPSANRSASPHSSSNMHPPNLQVNLLKLINPSQVSSAIATSTGTRLLCSVTGGLLVVLSSIGFPLLGSWIISSILTFRPLYLVLLTSVMIIVTHLSSCKQAGHANAAREENRTPIDETGWVDHMGTSWELGLLIMEFLDAVVTDCSLYAVVVICGLSFFQKFI